MRAPEDMVSQTPGFAKALVEATRQATVGVAVLVEEGDRYRSVFANERLRALLGRTPSSLSDVISHESDEKRVATWLRSRVASPLVIDATRVGGTPADNDVRIVLSRVSGPESDAVVVFVYDSVARTRAERALAESQTRFRRLLDAVPDAIALGTKTRFLYANPACVRLLGYDTMDEVTRTPLRERIHPEDLGVARRILRALVSTGAPQPSNHIRLTGKDGRLVHIDMRPIALEWDGEPAMLGIGRDLTERRRVQAQIIRSDRLAAMGTLAAGVAHEINNPLAYLMLNLQYLMRELPRFDGDPVRLAGLLERLSEAEHGARRVSTIVGDLRTMSRADQEGFGPTSVQHAVAQAVKLASSELRSKARVVEDYGDSLLVHANAARLEQVFANLLVNAAHAIPEGHYDDNEIRVSVRAEGDSVIVSVSDTGSGIHPEILGRIFDPFFTTKPRGVGTGLGLPISLGIVTSFGGSITVDSVPGAGTTFRVSLPGQPLGSSPVSSEAIPSTLQSLGARRPSARTGRARVLIVDDERPVADMIQRALSDAHDVTVATDAETALGFILSGPQFDLIFCDLLMPRVTGMDLYEQLRDRCPGVEETIVFMTGGAFTERSAQFLANVSNRTLTKPFDLVELESIVSNAVRSDR